jgi:hypothetical protein
MHIEVRVEMRSPRWKEIVLLWKDEGVPVELRGSLGSVIGVFKMGSTEYMKIIEFYEQYRNSLNIRYEEHYRAVYEASERKDYELHILLCDTVFDVIPIKANYSVSKVCDRCGRKNHPVRIGPMILQGNEYHKYQIFFTELDEVVVGTMMREQLIKSAPFSGLMFETCTKPTGEFIPDYWLLGTKERIGHRLDERGNALYCPDCGQWVPTTDRHFPPWYIYSKQEWDGSEVSFTSDTPPLLCVKTGLIEVLERVEKTISLERCLPVHLV